MDGVFQTGGPVELTEGFQFNAAFQHYWTPALRTSVFGGYSELHFPGTHTAAPGLGAPGVGTGARGAFCTGTFSAIFAANNVNGCNPDFSIVQVGTRTVWSPVRNLDIGVEVLYTRLDQNFDGTFAVAPGGGRAASTFNAKDQDTWSGVLRFQRNFWP
jgi:hypothetical protein